MGETFVNISNAARKVADAYRKEGGVWVPATELYASISGVAKQVFIAEVTVDAGALGIQSLESIFNGYQAGLWAANTKKRLKVAVDRGPLQWTTDFGGDLVIEVTPSGSISGLSGAGSTSLGSSGVAGGDALIIGGGVTKKATISNEGVIRGAGGGGGKGGTGGAGGLGYRTWVVSEGPIYNFDSSYFWVQDDNNNAWEAWWGGRQGMGSGIPNSVAIGAITYYKGSQNYYTGGVGYYAISRTYSAGENTPGGNGGAGGNGGRGIGYGVSATNGLGGSGGAPGGENAGTGGTGGSGGNGGNWASPGGVGNIGNTGGNGNAGNGYGGGGGTSGGAAGKGISDLTKVIYTGSGTLLGNSI
ncbi:hypothetical protein KIP58_21680 [Xanthomonas campestris pv. campestris]|nr:hypothetical protein [Xanthomonas campestris]MCF8861602.1 hypothetical protein [Xanthomonas campestris pv. campestris]